MNLSKIDTLSSELKTLPPLTQGEHNRINGDFAIEYVYNSNAIEGNSLTLRETALVLQHGVVVPGKSLKDHIEAVGHLDAYNLVLKLVSENETLSEKIIKRLHSLVLMNDNANRGVYRNVPVTILGAGFAPPPPELIPAQMERLIDGYPAQLSKLHIIEAVSLFHLQFEAIHPFIDGNGRTGRLLLNMELMRVGLLPIDIKFVDRDKYYSAFDAYHNNGGDFSRMAELVCDYELERLEKIIDILKTKTEGAGNNETQ